MNDSALNNKNSFWTILKFIIPSVLLFACTLLFMPEMGVLRTFPFLAVGGMVACFFGMTVKTSIAMSAIMTLCMYLFSGKELVFSIGFSVVACVICALGVYVTSLVRIAAHTQKNKLRKKCIILSVVAAFFIILVSAVTCGNPFSYLSEKAENQKYIETYYKDDAEIKYTRYAPMSAEYRTYVKFYKDGNAYGADDECYVSKNHDGIREVFAQDVLDSASMLLSKLAASSDGGFYVVGADLEFLDNEVRINTDNGIGYFSRISYVLNYDGLIGKKDRGMFEALCQKTLSKIDEAGFVFDTIVLCGGDASDVYFSAVIDKDSKDSELSSLIKTFEEKDVLAFGITKENILAYWQNN